jgi:hypothetical protein
MSDHVAKPDYARVHLALARRALGIPVEVPELDDDQAAQLELDDAVARHPAGDSALSEKVRAVPPGEGSIRTPSRDGPLPLDVTHGEYHTDVIRTGPDTVPGVGGIQL